MRQVEVAVIGTGWCGGIRAETLSRSALVDKLHICEIRPERLATDHLTRPRPDYELAPDRASADAAPDEVPEAGEVLAAIRAMRVAYREILLMRLCEGMSVPEIAERSGLTAG